MARRGRHPRGRRGQRRTRPGRRPASSRRPGVRREPDLLIDVRGHLASDDPLDLLTYVSGLMAAVDPRRRNPFAKHEPAVPPLAEFMESFLAVLRVETTALLATVAALSADQSIRAAIGPEIERRRHPLPAWIGVLEDAAAVRAVETIHPLGDGENVAVDVRLPDGTGLSALAYVDHNLGSVVKDGLVVRESIEDLAAAAAMQADDQDVEWREIGLADARARIEQAVEFGAITFPPLETESWPACRPIVEWAARLCPGGGSGYERPHWPERAVRDLAQRFFSSPHGRPLDSAERRGLLESVLWFGTDYGPGDPMRWSPSSTEILLLDWIPRKIVADVGYLGQAPALLEGFIRFCHAERGIPERLTHETLAALRRFVPEYQQLIRTPRPQGAAGHSRGCRGDRCGRPLGRARRRAPGLSRAHARGAARRRGRRGRPPGPRHAPPSRRAVRLGRRPGGRPLPGGGGGRPL